MAVLPVDICPHCLKENVVCQVAGQYQHPNGGNIFTVFMVCGNCYNGIVARMRTITGTQPVNYGGSLADYGYFEIMEISPKVQPPDIPGFLPADINNLFHQAANNLKRKQSDAVGMLCRRLLDRGIKALDPDAKGTLNQRIDVIAEKHLITPALREWAHAIRLMGNDTEHSDKLACPEDAQQIYDFTDIFLRYAFTIPGMLEQRKTSKT